MNTRLGEGNVVRTATRILAFAGLASLALVCAKAAWSQGKSSQAESAVARPVATAPEASPGLQASSATPSAGQATAQNSPAKPSVPKSHHDGITVHGHWIIEVRNPDGTRVSRTEFENSITNQGADILTGLLSGEYVAGGFVVDLSSASNSGLCFNGFCALYDKRVANCAPAAATAGSCGTLTYTPNVTTVGGPTVGYTLTGNVQPASGGQIVSVQTLQTLCTGPSTPQAIFATTSTAFAEVSPQTCSSSQAAFEALTSAPTAQTVVAGQSVSVTVVITFGSN